MLAIMLHARRFADSSESDAQPKRFKTAGPSANFDETDGTYP